MIRVLDHLLDRLARLVGVDPEKLRYLAVGGVNTVFGLSIFPALMLTSSTLRANYLVTLALSQALSIVFSFSTYKTLVFRSSGRTLPEFAKFVGFNLAGIAANWAIVPALVEFDLLDPIVAQVGFTILWVVGSYFWHRAVTFAQRPSRKSLDVSDVAMQEKRGSSRARIEEK